MFSINNDDLNDEQKKAIYEENSVLLLACPGSGKTRTLIYKIAYELSRIDSIKKFVIAITYTNRAAEEIKERVEILGVDTTQLWIGTIHSFCLHWILRPYHLYLENLKYGFNVINSYDSEKIITELCEKYKNPRINFWDCGVEARTDGIYLTCMDENKHSSLVEIMGNYYKILLSNKQIDFEQILKYSWDLLEENSIICKALSKIFSTILIDEYQDTKEIQYNIIAKILKANNGCTKVFIVGDPNQSIYASLGGFPMLKSDLEGLLGFNLVSLSLERNYRSSSKIVEYFNYYKVNNAAINAFGVNKDYPSLLTYNNTVLVDDLIKEISNLILINIKNYNIAPNEICIAAPHWIHIGVITRKLMVMHPDLSFDGPGMAPFSRDIDNFWFKVSKILLTEPSPDMYIRRLRWSSEILKDLELLGINTMHISNKELLRVCNSIKIFENDGLKYLESFFSILFKKLNIDWELIPSLQNHHKSFFESSSQKMQKLLAEGLSGVETLENFKKVFKQKEGITVSTIHGVKGEEYDTVIGFALLDGFIPHFGDQDKDKSAKMMLYVLASRARKNLHLISEKNRGPFNHYTPDGKKPTPQLEGYTYTYDDL
ncbi:ATP-dependent helicase [Acinetobacter sp. NIPH 1958]|uniref:ATP-dependent helicase n=1 Tax=Acinetobacter TaxID=469 RepID=UPI001331D263|nr:ATP-dependent helicase [Acinetobacter haemolyticus]MCH7355909.1 ATP-dependent helicase [Acinetobacter sp. NIPH 1958]QHI28624.1 ATP-dependent helicase [Acinetobacter haemolyticus]